MRYASLRLLRPTARQVEPQNALKVMMVRVSWMPGMLCTFSLTKWPMSVPVLDVEFHQQVEVAGGRIDLGGDLGVGELVGHR